MRIHVALPLVLVLTLCMTGCTLSFSGPAVDTPPPVVVDEPASVEIVQEDAVPVIAVEEYYFVGGRYYYWHPGVGRYVVLRGAPPPGFRVRAMARLEPRRGPFHPVEHRPSTYAPPHPVQRPPPAKRPAPEKKKQESK